MKYNKPLTAVLLGFLSTIPYELITQILIYFGIGKYSVYQLTSLMITLNRPVILMGMIMSFIVASIISLVFYYSTKKIGANFLIFKSILISLIGWGAIETLFVAIIEGPKLIDPRPLNDYYIHGIGNVIFGISLGILSKKYLFKNTLTLSKGKKLLCYAYTIFTWIIIIPEQNTPICQNTNNISSGCFDRNNILLYL